jgi:hypothetical protein
MRRITRLAQLELSTGASAGAQRRTLALPHATPRWLPPCAGAGLALALALALARALARHRRRRRAQILCCDSPKRRGVVMYKRLQANRLEALALTLLPARPRISAAAGASAGARARNADFQTSLAPGPAPSPAPAPDRAPGLAPARSTCARDRPAQRVSAGASAPWYQRCASGPASARVRCSASLGLSLSLDSFFGAQVFASYALRALLCARPAAPGARPRSEPAGNR